PEACAEPGSLGGHLEDALLRLPSEPGHAAADRVGVHSRGRRARRGAGRAEDRPALRAGARDQGLISSRAAEPRRESRTEGPKNALTRAVFAVTLTAGGGWSARTSPPRAGVGSLGLAPAAEARRDRLARVGVDQAPSTLACERRNSGGIRASTATPG